MEECIKYMVIKDEKDPDYKSLKLLDKSEDGSVTGESALYRIRAMIDINDDVKAGDIGGFVESEENLCTNIHDKSWIYDNSIVCKGAYIEDGAKIYGTSIIHHNAHIKDNAVISDSNISKARIAGDFVIDDMQIDAPIVMQHGNGYMNVDGAIVGHGAIVEQGKFVELTPRQLHIANPDGGNVNFKNMRDNRGSNTITIG